MSTEEELRKELKSLQDEYVKLQDHLTDVELKYQSELNSNKDDKHKSSLLSFISNLFNQQQYSDIKIILKEGTTLYGHKLILSALNINWGISDLLNQQQLDLSEINSDIGYCIIKWIYTGIFEKDVDDLFLSELFKVAVELNCQLLVNRIQEILIERVDKTNYGTYHQLAITISAHLLQNYCENMILNHEPGFPVKVDNDLKNDIENNANNDNVPNDNDNDVMKYGNVRNENVILKAEHCVDNNDNEGTWSDNEMEDLTVVRTKPIKSNKTTLKNPSKTKTKTRKPSKRKLTMTVTCKSKESKNENTSKSKMTKNFNASKYIGNSLNCHFCCVEFKDVSSLEKHLEEHAFQTNPFSCNKCDTRDIPTRKQLLRHLSKHETRKCRFCEQIFDNTDDLKAHKLSEHPKDQRYKCLACGKCYARKTPYVIHLRVHSGEKPYTCEVCGKAFNERGSLKVHGRIHTGVKSYICDVCGKAYYSSTLLNKHLRLHSPNGAYSFVCTTCGHKFTQKCHLQTHELIHTGVKPHQCNYCGKMFTDKSSFNRHNKTHTGERPHVCTLCGKAFIQRVQLIKHNISHEKQRMSLQMKYDVNLGGFNADTSVNLQ